MLPVHRITSVVGVRHLFSSFAKTCMWNSWKSHNSAMTAMSTLPKTTHRKQNFDYFLVLDFEATCEDGKQIKPQEIIEWPVLKVNSSTWETESVFHQYIRPREHPELTPFCTQLTGIIQDMVDDQPHIEEAMQLFHEWMLSEGLLDGASFAFVTCGDWDLKKMLPSQCEYFQLPVPKYMQKWINIKEPFSDVTSVWSRGMMTMLSHLQLKHVGRHHSGIDDCKNIANILKAIGEKGYIFKITGQISG